MDKLRTFLSRAGDKPYRSYIARIIRSVGVDTVVATYQVELGRAEKELEVGGGELTSRIGPAYDNFVDHMRQNPPAFWERFSCHDAIEVIRREIVGIDFGAPDRVLSEEAGENLIYTYFLAFSFRFAEDAHGSKVIRRAMGIRKNILWQ